MFGSRVTCTALTLLVIVTLAKANWNDRQAKLRQNQRKKARCPDPLVISEHMILNRRVGKYMAGCQVTGDRTDTCNMRMSCCENAYQEMLCVRARKYKNMPVPAVVPPPVDLKSVASMLDDAPATCPLPMVVNDTRVCKGYNADYKVCAPNSICEDPRRICCPDPCSPAPLVSEQLHLCFPSSEAEVTADLLAPPKVVNEQHDFRSDMSGDGIKVERYCPTPGEFCPPESNNCICKDMELMNREYPLCKADAECAPGLICCSDPCEALDTQRCFVDEVSMSLLAGQSAGKESTKRTDPPPPAPVGSKMQNDAVESKAEVAGPFVCPRGEIDEFSPCIAWSSNGAGTGICKPGDDKECAPAGRKCCPLSGPNCNDSFNYCVTPVDMSKLPIGCPAPFYFEQKNAADACQKEGCSDGMICCPIDVQGSYGCTKPAV